MRQRNAVVALVTAACLGLAGCAADEEAPVRADAPSPAATAEPGPVPAHRTWPPPPRPGGPAGCPPWSPRCSRSRRWPGCW
ncbi:hypothetical protein [Georgenia sp. SUBG003]|uniref:hypothetical protein n=1 Tax=Georgenia sp. SUBG003 TaxID=1497974 RepID=UPI003AB7BF53